MPAVCGELEVTRPPAEVYDYLRGRYETNVFRSVCMMTKGYVPEIRCLEEVEDQRITFSAAGRDSLLRFKISSWTWSYQLTRVEDDRTKVAITYRWSLWLSLLSMFTVRHQAANELIETALALEALAASR